jgi:hypothetical protein
MAVQRFIGMTTQTVRVERGEVKQSNDKITDQQLAATIARTYGFKLVNSVAQHNVTEVLDKFRYMLPEIRTIVLVELDAMPWDTDTCYAIYALHK